MGTWQRMISRALSPFLPSLGKKYFALKVTPWLSQMFVRLDLSLIPSFSVFLKKASSPCCFSSSIYKQLRSICLSNLFVYSIPKVPRRRGALLRMWLKCSLWWKWKSLACNCAALEDIHAPWSLLPAQESLAVSQLWL